MAMAEASSESHKCVFCSQLFPSKTDLQLHFRLHGNGELDMKGRPKVKHKTTYEDVRFKYTDGGDVRSDAAYDKDAAECDVCGEVFHTVSLAIAHKFKKHPDSLLKHYCSYCGMMFPIKANRDKHLLAHTGSTPKHHYPCRTCGVTFYTPRAKKFHMDSAHKGTIRLVSPISTPSPSMKIVVNNAGEPQSVYYCHLCGCEYQVKYNLQKHLAAMHTGRERDTLPQEVVKCNLCSALFYTRRAYEVHSHHHRDGDLFAKSEEMRQQVVHRIDQDFDQRRVPTQVEQYLSSQESGVKRKIKVRVKRVTETNNTQTSGDTEEGTQDVNIHKTDKVCRLHEGQEGTRVKDGRARNNKNLPEKETNKESKRNRDAKRKQVTEDHDVSGREANKDGGEEGLSLDENTRMMKDENGERKHLMDSLDVGVKETNKDESEKNMDKDTQIMSSQDLNRQCDQNLSKKRSTRENEWMEKTSKRTQVMNNKYLSRKKTNTGNVTEERQCVNITEDKLKIQISVENYGDLNDKKTGSKERKSMHEDKVKAQIINENQEMDSYEKEQNKNEGRECLKWSVNEGRENKIIDKNEGREFLKWSVNEERENKIMDKNERRKCLQWTVNEEAENKIMDENYQDTSERNLNREERRGGCLDWNMDEDRHKRRRMMDEDEEDDIRNLGTVNPDSILSTQLTEEDVVLRFPEDVNEGEMED